MKPIVFLRIAWMIDYKGVTDFDIPNGAGSYVKEHSDGGEVRNFLPEGSNVYGYVRIGSGKGLRIQRLGAGTADLIDSVIVVFFATNPFLHKQVVVGWYDDATLYRNMQVLRTSRGSTIKSYVTVTSKRKSTLLPISDRTFPIPADGPGQTNAWYVMEYRKSSSFLGEFFKFKNSPTTYHSDQTPSKGGSGGSGWQRDSEKRKMVEDAAMAATEKYFLQRGFSVSYVHLLKKGWDLEAKKDNTVLFLEVKGTEHSLAAVMLTPKEFAHSKAKGNYRICILENALGTNPKFHLCQLHKNQKYWVSESGEHLKIEVVKSALLILQ